MRIKFVFKILIICFVGLSSCGPTAFFYNNGKMLISPEKTPCGNVRINAIGDKKDQLIQISFTETIPDRNLDSISITGFKNGKGFKLLRSENYNEMDRSSFFIVTTAPGGLSFFAPAADSLQIDLSKVLILEGTSCFPDVLTLIPKEKK